MVRAAMMGTVCGRADPWCQTVTWLRERVAVLESECRALRAERDQLAGRVERLGVDNQRLQVLRSTSWWPVGPATRPTGGCWPVWPVSARRW
jgi:hypothetical protein